MAINKRSEDFTLEDIKKLIKENRELRLENLIAHSSNFFGTHFLKWKSACSLKMIKNVFFPLHGLGIRL